MISRRPAPRTGVPHRAIQRLVVRGAEFALLLMVLSLAAVARAASSSPAGNSAPPVPREAAAARSRSALPAHATSRPAASAPLVEQLAGAGPSRAGFVVPQAARAGKAVPLVVWLHGGIGANNPAKGVAAAQGFAVLADTGRFALLCPSAWPSSPWWSEDAAHRVASLIRMAMRRPGVGRRLVIAGTSDGGAGALWLAARLRGEFGDTLSAVAVWSCSADLLAAVGAPWDSRRLAGLPLRWTQGDRDRLFAIDGIRRQWVALRQAGIALEERTATDAGHDLADHQQDLARFPQWLRGLHGPTPGSGQRRTRTPSPVRRP